MGDDREVSHSKHKKEKHKDRDRDRDKSRRDSKGERDERHYAKKEDHKVRISVALPIFLSTWFLVSWQAEADACEFLWCITANLVDSKASSGNIVKPRLAREHIRSPCEGDQVSTLCLCCRMMTTQTSYALSWKGESETKGKIVTFVHCEALRQPCTTLMDAAGSKPATGHVAFSLVMLHAATFLPFTLVNVKPYRQI